MLWLCFPQWTQSDIMKGSVKTLNEGFARLQDCTFIWQDNKDLKARTDNLEKKMMEMDTKMDDLDGLNAILTI